MPAIVAAQSYSISTITRGAGAWAALANPLSASITNPSSTHNLLVQASYGASLVCNGSTGLSAGLAVSGGVTITASAWGIGEQIHIGNLALSIEISALGLHPHRDPYRPGRAGREGRCRVGWPGRWKRGAGHIDRRAGARPLRAYSGPCDGG
jgi:hypothetical protein